MSTKKLQILGTSLGNNVYTQPEEPTDAPDGSLWVDTDAEAQSNSVSIDASLTIEGQAADAKATGDAIRSLSEETDPTVPDWAKQPTKPSYTAEEVGALPINTVIPTVPDNVSAFRNDAGYLTEHQDISGKLDASELPTAINTALAQAKASGEFDGADGVGIQSVEQTTTSTEDGGTNVVTVTRTDGTSSTFQIKNGSRGQDATVDASLTQSGKAADAAVVGQRLSTLSEEMLTKESDPTVPAWAKEAQKPSYTAYEVGADPSGTAAAQVAAHNSGTDTHSDIRVLIQGLTDRLNALADSDDTTLDQLSEVVSYIKSNRTLIEAITTSKVSVADIIDNLTTNVTNKPLSAAQGVALKALIDAITIPEALPNPNALTFTGAVTGTYDGSAPLEVAIPSGEGGTGGGDDVFELIGEATSSGVSDASGLTIPFDGSLYKTIIAYAYNLPAGNKKRIIIRKKKAWYDGCPMGWNTVIDTYLPSLTDMKNTWGFFGAAIDVGGKLFALGAAEAYNNGGHGFFRFWPQSGALPTLSLSDCKFISLDCNSNSEMLPDGCSLIVWGVRK